METAQILIKWLDESILEGLCNGILPSDKDGLTTYKYNYVDKSKSLYWATNCY